MSAKTRLTDISVQRLPEGTYWDASTPAFGIRVGKRFRTFICVRDGGNRISIGRYPNISLQDARKEAKALLLGVMEKKTGTGFQDAVARYLRRMEGELRPRTLYEYGLILKRQTFPTTNVSAAEITEALDKIEKVSARSHTYAVLRIFCNWCVQQGHMSSSPMIRVRKPKVQAPRERVLTDAELVKIWNACHDLGKYGALIRLLMLTGQRKGQFAGLREDWVDEKSKTLVFPASAMKTKREYRVPYVYPVDVLLMRNGSYKGYYFSPTSALGQPFSAWSKNKDQLDRMIDIDPWTLHDLRRTWSTNAARLDIPPHITERVLSHVAPEGKIAAIYNRYRYEDEIRAAMKKMADWLMLQIQEEGTPDPLHQIL